MSNKGSEYERYISKYLTNWLTGKSKPYYFWRSPSSGMLGTIYEENIHLKGDIIPIKEEIKDRWPLVIECKNGYPKTSFWQHFISTKFCLEDFWKQTVEETPKDKYPMLIYRKKGRKSVVGIDDFLYKRLYKKLNCLNHICIRWNDKSKLQDCLLYDMDGFFKAIKPNDILEIG